MATRTTETTPKTQKAPKTEPIRIPPPNERLLHVRIEGTAPYVQLAFGAKARNTMLARQLDPTLRTKGRGQREAKNLDECYEEALHRSASGSYGIPAAGLRQGCIDACRLVSFKMTQARMSIFIEADDFDKQDGTPLIPIHGTPEPVIHPVRNANGGADMRVRAMWRTWWSEFRVRYDADQFKDEDVVNLLLRVGLQVGLGEGRPFSRKSGGMGWGTFTVTRVKQSRPKGAEVA